MKTIINEHNLIKTYPLDYQKRAYQYVKAIKFKGKLSVKLTAKKLNIPFGRVNDWFYAKNKPFPIRAVIKAKLNNWIPISPSLRLAYLVGYNMGDGHLAKDLHYIAFVNKSKKTLFHIGNELNELFNLKLNLNKYIFWSGTAYTLTISDSTLSRIFYAIGTPKGNKTKTKFLIPQWIYDPRKYNCNNNLTLEIQRAYLQGLNDSELVTPYLNVKNYNSLDKLKLEMHKVKDLAENNLKFFKQLNELYRNLDV